MIRLTPEQLAAAIAFATRHWTTPDHDDDGAAQLVRLGVPPRDAHAVVQACREAFAAGYLSTAVDADPVDQNPPHDPALAEVWEAGRATFEQEQSHRGRDRVIGLVIVALFVIAAVVFIAVNSF